MRILVVAHTFPWPETSGGRMRVANVVRALSRAGEVEVFSIVSKRERQEADAVIPALEEPVARLGSGIRKGIPFRPTRVTRWLVASRSPYEIGTADYSDIRSAFLAWLCGQYDVVWMSHADSFVALSELVKAPCIVDLDDLEDHKISVKRRLRAHTRPPGSVGGLATPRARIHHFGAHVQSAANARRWGREQRRIAASAHSVAVCSRIDQQRLGVSNSVVIPNGYDPPPHPVGRTEVGDPPTLMLPGSLTYTPNADSARFLVQEILPRVRARLPRVRARLVGRYDDRVAGFASDHVVLTGQVPEMRTELAEADVIVAPIRFGSGTRIKILEAFAHRIPVVSTSVGCEGLEAVAGQHLMVADEPDAFASSCVDLLVNVELRRRLTEAAHRLFWERYRWDAIAPTIVEATTRVADVTSASESPALSGRRDPADG
jgi:glycosyltransferase involved in cell wall biosynthesis